MKGLAAAVWLDVRLQLRNGFYAAVGLVTLLFVGGILQINHYELGWLVPSVVAGNLIMNPLYFIAGMVLLEEQEGTLPAQFVSPLRSHSYVVSKVLTLSALAIAENSLVAWAAVEGDLASWPFLLGLFLGSCVVGLFGLGFVLGYRSISDFILPSILLTGLLILPILDQLGLLESWIYWLHPMQGPIRLMDAAFRTASKPEQFTSLLLSLGWIAVALAWCDYRLSRRKSQW